MRDMKRQFGCLLIVTVAALSLRCPGEEVYGIGDEVRRIITPQGGAGAAVMRSQSGSMEAAGTLAPAGFDGPVRDLPDDLVVGDGDSRLRVRFDAATGALDLFHAPGIRPDAAARSRDVYATALQGTGSELDDRVVRRLDMPDIRGRPRVTFICANPVLGCQVRKEYTIDAAHGELIKRVTLAGEVDRIVAVESATVVPSTFRSNTYYRAWMEHVGRHRSAFLSASIADAVVPYPSRLDNTRKQPCVLVLNKLTEDAGYGEAAVEINGVPVPHYIGVGGSGIKQVPNLHRLTVLTPAGWQIARGLIHVRPDAPQTLTWVYRFYRGSFLDYHRDYHARYYEPGFAPPARPEKIDRAFDLANTTPMARWDEETGRMVPTDGYRSKDPPPGQGRPGVLYWQAAERFLDELSPDAWGSFILMESSFMTLGDVLADHLYASYWEEATPHRRDTWTIDYPAYADMVAYYREKLPRIQFFRYDNVGWFQPGAHTARRVPHLDSGYRFKFWYYLNGEQMEFGYAEPDMERLMALPYLRDIALGVHPYDDFDFHGDTLVKDGDGVRLYPYFVKQRLRRETAAMIHSAGAMYFSNHPCGGWSDLGYSELFNWDADNPLDWRYLGDRLALQKLHEWGPGTTAQLYFMSQDYPLRVIAYNFVPNISSRYGAHLPNALLAALELVRARWYLREARVAPVVMHPAAWHYQETIPFESAVMSLPGTVYLPVINHTSEPVTEEFSVDLGTLIPEAAKRVWKTTMVAGPWIRDHGKPIEGARFGSHGYAFDDEKLEVKVEPLADPQWEDRRLAFRDTVGPRSLAMYFIPTVPALVREVDGKPVPWPVGSQPEIDINLVADGLLIDCRRDRAVVSVDPAFGGAAVPPAKPDALGYVPLELTRGKWLLTRTWRLVSETEKALSLQNGVDGYAGQVNDQVSAGGWGPDKGYAQPGDLNQPDLIFVCKHAPPKQKFTAHTLIRFDLAGRVPASARVVAARMILAVDNLAAGASTTLEWYPARRPWQDNRTHWTGWGNGGAAEGYLGGMFDETFVSTASRTIEVDLPVSLMREWLEDPARNHGVLVKMREPNGVHLSIKGARSDAPPRLEITYKDGE